jgi:sugar-specific transcriptional regulator TrmB
MNATPPDDPRLAVIEQLEQFGLSAYAARTFIALFDLGSGTAKEVSHISEVPRTRVYDAAEELRERGLVDIKQATPKEFHAVSAETASRKFEREMRERTGTMRTALQEIEPQRPKEEQRGVWTVDGQEAVTDRVLGFVETAEEEIVYMSVEELLTDKLVDALRDAAERGVAIKLGGLSPSVQEQLRTELPEADLFNSLWVWSETPVGRLMMADREGTLVSVLVNGEQAKPSDPRSETAIWGTGQRNSLVVVFRALFAWRLDHEEA